MVAEFTIKVKKAIPLSNKITLCLQHGYEQIDRAKRGCHHNFGRLYPNNTLTRTQSLRRIYSIYNFITMISASIRAKKLGVTLQ